VRFTPQDEQFRTSVRDWLDANLTGEFAALRGAGGPGREHEHYAARLAWHRHLAASGWTCLGWPAEHGGRGATLAQQVIFHEEYARAAAPARVSIIGEELLGPTLIEFGSPDQRKRFLPPIKAVTELWCQGYSEPGAGSDLASVSTKATREKGVGPGGTGGGSPPCTGDVGGQWVVTGQKVWTSGAHEADWCFVLARTEPGSARGHGLSYLLVPMRQPGVTVRPIRQLTGTSEFNEVFFDGARTDAANMVGAPGDGWRIAKATLAVERGAAMLGQQVGFRRDLENLLSLARGTEAGADPLIRDRLARAWTGLEVIRAYALDTLGGDDATAASVLKILWSRWYRSLGELAMDVLGASSAIAKGEPYDLDEWQRLFLFSRAATIYGGSDEIQRNIIASRILPRHP
jgi:alkylation response protein AidB-like acyl-CoA dehydrogenase